VLTARFSCRKCLQIPYLRRRELPPQPKQVAAVGILHDQVRIDGRRHQLAPDEVVAACARCCNIAVVTIVRLSVSLKPCGSVFSSWRRRGGRSITRLPL
jgi:hypothetical protein